MREPVLIVWLILAIIASVLLKVVIKKKKRQLGRYGMVHQLILLLISFGISWLVFYFLHGEKELVWVLRATVITIASINVWVMYAHNWARKSSSSYEEDSFLPEFMFVFLSGTIASIAFVLSPKTLGLLDYSVHLSKNYWAFPILFVLPYLIVKLIHFSTHFPMKMVENPWVFPLEPVNTQQWPWRDLIQVNFEVKKSLQEEYNMYTWVSKPWIEVPKEIPLGAAFQLCIQERRKRQDLETIQDLGDEYEGKPEFSWLFYLKVIWYKPRTWRYHPRHINPDDSIRIKKLKNGDVIIVKRITGIPVKKTSFNYHDVPYDSGEKTVLIQN